MMNPPAGGQDEFVRFVNGQGVPETDREIVQGGHPRQEPGVQLRQTVLGRDQRKAIREHRADLSGGAEFQPAHPHTFWRTENRSRRNVRAVCRFCGAKKRGKIRTRSSGATPSRHSPVVRPGIVGRPKYWCTNS